jgi:hypothetical protein
MFPKELSKFKIKKRATTAELNEYLEEMQAIINISGVDVFIIDVILTSFQTIEGFSAKTKFNISGLSVMLKNNPQFHHLAKQLYLKYNTFSSIPGEYQMALLIFSTAYICLNKNLQKEKFDAYLNQPVNV